MPIYEYLCPQCKTELEELRSIAEGRFGRCPKCNHRAYKVPSMFSFKFQNPFTKDGEGFTSRNVPLGELKEMSQETRSR